MADKGKAAESAEPTPVGATEDPASKQAAAESDDDSGDDDQPEQADGAAAGTADGEGKKKKKKKKTKKLKQMLGMGGNKDGDSKDDQEAKAKSAIGGLTQAQLAEFIKLNPALANELGTGSGAGSSSSVGLSPDNVSEVLKKLKLQDILTGLASSGKNKKDMASYKFWNTQPVPQFGEDTQHVEEGPLKVQTVDEIPAEPTSLVLDQFRWVTMDLTDETQMEEVYKLLNGHYVEDDESMFRFKYSTSILKWALMSPGWKQQWHVGIRSGNTLCAFISAIPTQIRVRDKVVSGSEVNFLCVHKKLRNKRLAPVLIKEITRLCNREGVFQAIYTGGIVLPRPVSTCRYFHRAINWQKLWEVGFSPLPSGSKPQLQVRKYSLPENTAMRGWREMKAKDVDAVYDLLTRYLKHYQLAPEFSKEEIEHWMLHKKDAPGEQVVWAYVVEDSDKKITDFISFYCLESSVINHPKHNVIRAAYLFYYATETFFTKPDDRGALKTRLNELVHDALIVARRYHFDVFNAVSLMENALFLEEQKFGPGDGQLHYYLFNYRANPIHGGVDKRNQLDQEALSGVGFVML